MTSTTPSLRERADRFIHHPVTELVIVALIVTAVAALLVEPAFPRGHPTRRALEGYELAVTGAFAVELSLRWWVAPRKRRFFARYWLDILAILPLARPLRIIRVLLLMRMFRAGVLLSRRVRRLQGLVRGTASELVLLAVVCAMVWTAATVLIHASADGFQLDEPGIAGAAWYASLTLISGEPNGGQPLDDAGRLLTLALMVSGLTVFGVFIGTVSAAAGRLLADRLEDRDMELDDLRDHIVICGWNPAGVVALAELLEDDPDRPVVIVTERGQPDLGAEGRSLPLERVYFHTGDSTRVEVLEEVGIRRASAAILLIDTTVERADTDRDARTVLTALTIERMHPGIYCCAELVDGQHASLLEMAHVEEIVVRDWYAGAIIGSMGRNLGLAAVLGDILTARTGNAFRKVTVPRALAGRTVAHVQHLLKLEHDAILVGLERAASPGAPLVNPPADLVVDDGDRLVLISRAPVSLG